MSEQRKKRQNAGLRGRSGNGDHHRSGTTQNRNSKMNNHSSSQKPGFQRQTSYDRVRKIVQEEGRAARNLVTWSVPLDEQAQGTAGPVKIVNKGAGPYQRHRRSQSLTNAGQNRRRSRNDSTNTLKSSQQDPGNSPGSRPSSQNSMGTPSKKDLRARYWAFLFENLQRAVDEIYETCETDESVVECKEVIMMLEQCTKDFKNLIQRLQLLREFENKDASERPHSLAWEVRKSASPGKALSQSGNREQFLPSPTVSRSLNFGQPPSVQRIQVQGNSWADRVRGVAAAHQAGHMPLTQTQPSNIPEKPPVLLVDQSCLTEPVKIVPSNEDIMEEDDQEGWETVHRGGRGKTRPGSGTKSNRNSNQYQRTQSSPAQSSTCSTLTPGLQVYKDAPLSPGDRDKAAPASGGRARTSSHESHESRDSEKENRPAVSRDLNLWLNACSPPPLLTAPLGKHNQYESPKKPSPARQSAPHVGLAEALDNTGNQVAAPAPPTRPIEVVKDEAKPKTNRRSRSKQEHKLPDEDVFEDDNKALRYDEDAEKLASELEKALATVLDEEDTLTKKLVEEQDEALENAIQEEKSYLEEIEREESTDILIDTEPENETESELGNTHSTLDLNSSMPIPGDWDQFCQQHDAELESRSTISWGELAEEQELADGTARTPGRVVHMHEKLSSPSRKRSPTEARRRHETKQRKAHETREKLLTEKADRLRTLTNKVEEVRAYKDHLLEQRRDTIEHKLERAEMKRQLQLQLKVRRAHEEETKANEIAFINTLEAQNKRHDIMSKHQECEARLLDLQEEKKRKNEEKAAKEAAVEERRKALAAERQARLFEMQLKRKQRETEFEQKQQGKEKLRIEAARAKEQEREERIAALNKQQQDHIHELQKKIQQKQSDTDRRHKENLGHIQEKAFHMSILHHSTEDHNEAPKLVPYAIKKFCSVCNQMITSEVFLLSHLRGKRHQQAISDSNNGADFSKAEIEDFNLKHISDAPQDKTDPLLASDKERQKSFKKRCKKLRQRMTQRGTEYENSLSGKQQVVESDNRAKLQKVVKDLNKYLQSQGSGPWPQNKVSALDRALGEIGRIMEKKSPQDQTAFRLCGGLTTLCRVLLLIGQSNKDLPPVIPTKSLVLTSTVFKSCCKGSYDNCHYLLFSNKAGHIVDLLMHQLNMLIPDNFNVVLSGSMGGSTASLKLPFDPISSSLMQLISAVLSCLAKNNPSINSSDASAERMSTSGDAFMSRASDIVSYVVSVGVLDTLAQYFNNVRGPIDFDPLAGEFLQHSMGLLIALSRIMSKRNPNIFEEKKADDPTQLITTFKMTELVGIVSLMYGMLLHSDAPARGDSAPPELPPHTISVATVGFKMLNHMATLDLKVLQASLGEEGLSLEFRHIASYLLWYCSHWSNEELLHEVILCVGYFTVLNHDNQVIIQSGRPPTVLQQLCALPFQYFSNPRLTSILFPTLIACCYTSQRNREILEQELSCALLANFVEEKTLEAQQGKMSPASVKKSKGPEKELDTRMTLAARFPTEDWPTVQKYFSAP